MKCQDDGKAWSSFTVKDVVLELGKIVIYR